MTASDPFTSAARAEAERRNPPIDRLRDYFTYPGSVLREHKRGEFEAGAEWGRARLFAQMVGDALGDPDPDATPMSAEADVRYRPIQQEPTEAELDAGMEAMFGGGLRPKRHPIWRARVREAIIAARAARRDEEKQDG